MRCQPGLWLGLILLCTAECAAGMRADLSLNGEWEFQKVADLTYPPPGRWQPITVPGYLSGVNYERAWFRRRVEVPAAWRGRRVQVHFGGVKWNSTVYWNGQKVGGHFGGYEPFTVEVTDRVRFGEPNELLVGLHDWTGVFIDRETDLSRLGGSDARYLPQDKILAPVGGLISLYGIWDDVTLRALPLVYFRDLFIRPSVRQRRVEVEVTVVNTSDHPFTGTLQGRLFPYDGSPRDKHGQWPAPGQPVATFPPLRVKLAPGQERAFTLRLSDPPLQLWWPHDPRLYVLELRFNTPDTDVLRERMGWREFWIEGGDFYLNGAKVHLLATSWWPPHQPVSREYIRERLGGIKAMNAFAFRTHTQPWRRLWYEVADEVGLLMVPEGAIWNDDGAYRIYDPRFWDNYAAHLRGMVNNLKNHPSVVMWSLENEFYGGRLNDDSPAEADLARMGEIVKQADPTRPITYESDGDPGGVAEVIGLHYPNEYPQYTCWPNAAYWMDEPRLIHGGGGMFWDRQPFYWDRKKPLYIGEFLWIPSPDPSWHTVFFGDEAYLDYHRYRLLAKAEAWRMQILAYRHYEVSGISPWTVVEGGPLDERNPLWAAQRDLYRPLAAFVREYDRHFFGGETVTRTLELFNETMAEAEVRLWAEIACGEQPPAVVADQPLTLPPGARAERTLRFTVPPVTARTPLSLRVRLQREGEVLFAETYQYAAFPRPSLPPVSVYLYDPRGLTREILTAHGVTVRPVTSLADLPAEGALVIGAQALKAEKASGPPVIGAPPPLWQALYDFLRRGGRVLVLEQEAYPENLFPTSLAAHSSTMTFIQMPRHPVLAGVGKEDLKFWRGDHLVTDREPRRPVRGGFRALVVSGSAAGLAHAPLLEFPRGRGTLLLCQLKLISKFHSEPLAGVLLSNALRYLTEYRTPAGHTAVAAESPELLTFLRLLGLVFTDLSGGLAEADWDDLRVLLYQGSAGPLLAVQDELRAFVEGGGVLWLHGLRPEEFARLSPLVGNRLTLQPYTGPALRNAAAPDPLREAFTNEDLYWLGKHVGVGWATTPLATNVARAIFAKSLPKAGRRAFEAEDMTLQGTIVHPVEGGIGFFSTGTASLEVDFPADGVYIFGLVARGTPLDGVWPLSDLRVDGQRLGTFSVASDEWRTYTVFGPVTQGRHQVSISFTNDAYRPPEGDRNMFVDRLLVARDRAAEEVVFLTNPPALAKLPRGRGFILIDEINWDTERANGVKAARFVGGLLTALGATFTERWRVTWEAEEMTIDPTRIHSGRRDGYIVLADGGYVETSLRVVRAGDYTLELVARGTEVDDEYPLVEVTVDGKAMALVDVRSDSWHPFPVKIHLTTGRHMLRLTFTNDLYRPPEDRNFYLDKVEVYKPSW